METLPLTITSKTATISLGVVFLMLLTANILGLIANYHFGHPSVFGMVPMFDFDTERNVPTVFSSFLMVLSALLLLTISIIHKRKGQKAHLWSLLVVMFLFLAADEFLSLHELLNKPMRNMLSTSGPLYFAWVVPYGIFVGLMSIVYVRFLAAMPSAPRRIMLLSAVIYLTGALGLEMMGAWYFDSHRISVNLTYSLLTTVEESLEMLGLVVFVLALLVYIENVLQGVSVHISVAEPAN